ncbi:MAG: BrnT family toxin [Nitrospirae bacterium]|nr:BrnT family toxin [Nitrospirota bacterium]
MYILSHVEGFEWDKGNITKIWEKHGVSYPECEEAFFNEPLFVTPDEKHSQTEQRFRALGQTNSGKLLTIIFTIRGNGKLLRIISARNMNVRERRLYEQKT